MKTSGVAAVGLLAGCASTKAKSTKDGRRSVPVLPKHEHDPRQNLPITEEIDIAAKAGYTGIEPWLGKLNEYKNTAVR